MASSSDDSSGSFEILTPIQSNKGRHLESGFIGLTDSSFIGDPLISGAESQIDLTIKMPTPVTSSAAASNSTEVVHLPPESMIEIDGVKYVRADNVVIDKAQLTCGVHRAPTHSAVGYITRTQENAETKLTSPSSGNEAQPAPATKQSVSLNTGISANAAETQFVNSVSPETISKFEIAMESQASVADIPTFMYGVSSGLDGDVLNTYQAADEQRAAVDNDPDALPYIPWPVVQQIEEGHLEYPPMSIGHTWNRYYQVPRGDNEYFCSKPVTVLVGEGDDSVTYTVHQMVLAISPTLEKMCETKKAREDSSIALPDDDPRTFEYVVGFLYFHCISPPRGRDRFCNRQLMEIYAMADKYDVEGLKAVCLDVFDRDISADQLFRSVTIVYNAGADDTNFRTFFKDQVVTTLEKTLGGGNGGWQYIPSVADLASWSESGGNFATDLVEALMEVYSTRDVEEGEDEEIEVPGTGPPPPRSPPPVNGNSNSECESKNDGKSKINWNSKNDWNLKIDPSENPQTEQWACAAPQNQAEADTTRGQENGELRIEVDDLKEKIQNITIQLEKQRDHAWGPDPTMQDPGPAWQSKVARVPFYAQARVGPFGQGQASFRDGGNGGDASGAARNRSGYARSTCGVPTPPEVKGQTATAVIASSPLDCTLVFPAGAELTNLVPNGFACWGDEEYVGAYNGLCGTFPARYIHINGDNNLSVPEGSW